MTSISFFDFSFTANFKSLTDEKNSIDFWSDHWDNLMCQYDCNGKYDVQ